jgi:hypothetical protein
MPDINPTASSNDRFGPSSWAGGTDPWSRVWHLNILAGYLRPPFVYLNVRFYSVQHFEKNFQSQESKVATSNPQTLFRPSLSTWTWTLTTPATPHPPASTHKIPLAPSTTRTNNHTPCPHPHHSTANPALTFTSPTFASCPRPCSANPSLPLTPPKTPPPSLLLLLDPLGLALVSHHGCDCCCILCWFSEWQKAD